MATRFAATQTRASYQVASASPMPETMKRLGAPATSAVSTRTRLGLRWKKE